MRKTQTADAGRSIVRQCPQPRGMLVFYSDGNHEFYRRGGWGYEIVTGEGKDSKQASIEGGVPSRYYCRDHYPRVEIPCPQSEAFAAKRVQRHLADRGTIDRKKSSLIYSSEGILITDDRDREDYVIAGVWEEGGKTFASPVAPAVQRALWGNFLKDLASD